MSSWSRSASRCGAQQPLPTVVGPDYPTGAEAIQDEVETDRDLEGVGRLQRDCGSFFLRACGSPVRGVVLCLHGFSAGTYQYHELGAALSAAGFHVYAARLPGHGFQRPDATEDPDLLPPAGSSATYRSFAAKVAQQTMQLAKGVRLPWYVVGLSGGGAVALDILERRSCGVSGAVLVAPFLIIKDWPARLGLELVRRLHRCGMLPLGSLDHIPFGWGDSGRASAQEQGRRGHWDFYLGNIYALAQYARSVRKHATELSTPVQIIVNDNDDMIDGRTVERLFHTLGGMRHHRLMRLPRAVGAPHALLSARENPQAQTRRRVHEAIVTFFERLSSGCAGSQPDPASSSLR